MAETRCPQCGTPFLGLGPLCRACATPGPLFDAVCDQCGGPTQVPFEPDGRLPIFCRTCFMS